MRVILIVGLLVCSLFAGVAPAAGQTDDVTLTVAVVSESGEAIGGATIDASWDGGGTTVETASNGRAFVDVPEGADVALSVESENYIRNQPFVVEDATEREVTVEVARKGQLSVAVNDTEGPVEDVRVRLVADGDAIAQGRTDADGTYTSPDIEQGEYVVEFFKQGYYRNVTRVTVGESTQLNRSMRRGTTDVRFRVVDDHFSPPQELSEARVEVRNIGSQRLTGGAVTFTVPVNTRYTVIATREGYQTNETNIFVGANGETRTIAINRERELSVTLANDRVVVGEEVQVTVRNAYDEPVEGATISVGGESVATTGADGTASLPVEQTGEVEVVASADGISSDPVTLRGIATPTPTPATTPTDTPTVTATTAEPTGIGLPGFTPVVAVVAVLLAGLIAARRR